MVTQVSTSNRALLAAQGYGMELRGFSDHFISMYAHKKVGDKRIGDVAFKTRVGNLKSLDDGEATYMARKGAQGFFPWTPGEECMKRRFQSVTVTRGNTIIRQEPEMGCKWCRQAAGATRDSIQGPQGEADRAAEQTGRKPPADNGENVAPPASAFSCEKCSFTTTKGEWVLKGHLTRVHGNRQVARRKKQ